MFCGASCPPPPSYTNVVFQYPFDCDNKWLVKELNAFGTVKDVRFQKWTNIPDVSMDTCIVQMIRTRPIHRFLSVNGIRVKAWFKGRPIACDICCKEGHRAGACPNKGKCFRCHQAGHVSRNCLPPQPHPPGVPGLGPLRLPLPLLPRFTLMLAMACHL